MALHVELVSPERVVFEGDADLVIVRTAGGEIGFQAGHVPYVGVLQVAEARLKMTDGSNVSIAVHRGFVELANDHLTILSDVAELAEDIDVTRATEARDRADQAIAQDAEDTEAVGAKARAEVRLTVGAKA